jgi:hypothetical protein
MNSDNPTAAEVPTRETIPVKELDPTSAAIAKNIGSLGSRPSGGMEIGGTHCRSIIDWHPMTEKPSLAKDQTKVAVFVSRERASDGSCTTMACIYTPVEHPNFPFRTFFDRKIKDAYAWAYFPGPVDKAAVTV